jgi:pyridoxamine 5'-phosphate oxidase
MAIAAYTEPMEQFAEWFGEAQKLGLAEPEAVTVATADAQGRPSARVMLLKGHDALGFVLFTNLGSRKCRELDENPYAALCFHWMPLERQVRARGRVERVSEAEADAYFASRHRQSQLGAWASKQSQPLESPHALEKRVAKYVARFPLGEIPRPEFWGGFRVVPDELEFWQARPFRLHDRLVYRRDAGGPWRHEALYP